MKSTIWFWLLLGVYVVGLLVASVAYGAETTGGFDCSKYYRIETNGNRWHVAEKEEFWRLCDCDEKNCVRYYGDNCICKYEFWVSFLDGEFKRFSEARSELQDKCEEKRAEFIEEQKREAERKKRVGPYWPVDPKTGLKLKEDGE